MSERTTRDYLLLTLKGLAMGAADVVPGVSGGTIAFITGIYDELLSTLKKLGPDALLVLFKQGFAEFWRHINGNFLLCVFGGVHLSLKTLASVIGFCLENYPLLVWAFFSGLIGASVVLLFRHQTDWKRSSLLYCGAGVAVVIAIALSKPAQLPGEWWMLFIGGFIAICAMILPGVSGSFLLLLMGLYPVFLQAIVDFDIVSLLSFGCGCICGLLLFSRFLSWLLARFHSQTLSVLVGFLIGSLYVTWPWKQVTEFMTDRHGEQVPLVQANVSPFTYAEVVGNDPQLIFVILFSCIGLFLVLSVEFFAKKLVKNN